MKVSEIDTTTQIIGKGKRHRYTYISPKLMGMIKDYIKHRSYQ